MSCLLSFRCCHCFILLLVVFQVLPLFNTVARCVSGDANVSSVVCCVSGVATVSFQLFGVFQ